jgi:hypothetical protein
MFNSVAFSILRGAGVASDAELVWRVNDLLVMHDLEKSHIEISDLESSKEA